MIEAASRLHDAPWGLPLVLLLAAAGLYLTFLLRALQFRWLPRALRLTFVHRDEPEAEGDISHFQALSVMLASGVGAGSLVGVFVALTTGGPGALLWMWVAGILAMAIRFAEAVLGVRFRETDVRGAKSGGPMHYLEGGLRWGGLGRALGLAFAGFAVLAALGFGNGAQAHAVAAAIGGVSRVPPLLVGAVTATLVGAIVLGGIRSIGRVTMLLVPAVLLVYLVVAGWVLWANASTLPVIFTSVFEAALDGRAAGGGAVGFTLGQAVRGGLAGGLLAGEAGLGTGAIAAAAARTREPVRQALVAMSGTFIDTLVLGTVTGLLLMTAGPLTVEGGAGVLLATRRAFETVLPASGAAWFVALVLSAFAFTTILAWAYYGERSIRYVAGDGGVMPFRLFFVGIIPLGSVLELDLLWAISDSFRSLMALPTLVGVVLLSGIVVRETKVWLERTNGGPNVARTSGLADRPSGPPEDQPSNRR